MADNLFRFEGLRRIYKGFAFVWRARRDDSEEMTERHLRVSFDWPPIEMMYFVVSRYIRNPKDGFWLIWAQGFRERIESLSNALVKGAEAVTEDWVAGRESQDEIMADLETLEEECNQIKGSFKVGNVPRTPELKQANQYIDAFFRQCGSALYCGKRHFQEASGGSGGSDATTGLTNNGLKFKDAAYHAAQSAAKAFAIIEKF